MAALHFRTAEKKRAPLETPLFLAQLARWQGEKVSSTNASAIEFVFAQTEGRGESNTQSISRRAESLSEASTVTMARSASAGVDCITNCT